MENQAVDLSARLLATENISVVRNAVKTASFDIESRVLTLPIWKDMTPEIEGMLIGHEVGHALYTTDQYNPTIMAKPKIMGYLNILEDVRIEKLIKRKYPGLRKRMNEGYKQLNDRDFFGLKKHPLEQLILIDKINLYFKAGYQCGVKFDADEKDFVNRAERLETIEEVIELAEDLYKYQKEKEEEQKQQRQQQKAQAKKEEQEEDAEQEELDDYDQDPEMESTEEKDGNTAEGSTKAGDEHEDEVESQPVTDKNFQEQLEELADESTIYRYHKLTTNYPNEVVVSYKQVLEDTNVDFTTYNVGQYYKQRVYDGKTPQEYDQWFTQQVNKFKTDSVAAVNYLVKEFEMRKSAHQMKRAHTSKLGSLDMRKVYAYKLKDDLFKRITVLPDGKNHGMLMLVDWSGSMSDVIQDTMKQVINLCMFCNKVQIPYRVLAFTTQYRVSESEYHKLSHQYRELRNLPESYLSNVNHFKLLELFSNRMSMTEFNTMVRRVLDPRFTWIQNYDMGGTPLNEALAWVYLTLGDYIKENRIEKMNFITLSDGAGSSLQSTKGLQSRTVSNGKYITIKNLIRDEVTKKAYSIDTDDAQQSETLIRMIRDRWGVNVVGFYICANRRGSLTAALRDNVPGFKGHIDSMIESIRKSFRADGFYSLQGTGRNDLFIVPFESTKIDDSEMQADASMTSRALARKLGDYLNTKKTSRVLLSRFIDYVA